MRKTVNGKDKPVWLGNEKLLRVIDFCAQYVEIPTLEMITREGNHVTINLRMLAKYDPDYGFTPLRPDWDMLDVIYVLAAKAFNETWGIPRKQIVLLTQMDTPDLAALFVARALRRIYRDSTEPAYRDYVAYRAADPKFVLSLAKAYERKAGVVDMFVPSSKASLREALRHRNPKVRKQARTFLKQHRNF